MAKRLPKTLFVYLVETLNDGTPIYEVATSIELIPEAMEGDRVGKYTLTQQYKFRVRRELKP